MASLLLTARVVLLASMADLAGPLAVTQKGKYKSSWGENLALIGLDSELFGGAGDLEQ